MGYICCNGDCESCDLEYWKWINEKKIMVFGDRIRLRDCFKVPEDEEL